ncbi:MAG TPA: YciI family protein [Euzebya sp.]|nr:YciI family protein [Euzebya sp.]
MQYMLLIYSEPMDPDAAPDEGTMKRWFDYTAELQASGDYVAGDALMPIQTATTVRNQDGETLTTDGPFAETKEVLGGYYIVDVEDLDAALKWAARCPGADYGSIEVRPLVVFEPPAG